MIFDPPAAHHPIGLAQDLGGLQAAVFEQSVVDAKLTCRVVASRI